MKRWLKQEVSMYWYIKVLKNYAEFDGRARRKEYWMFYLVNILVVMVFGLITVMLANVAGEAAMNLFTVVYSIYALAVLIPCLAVTVRRLHDIGRSGWWVIGTFIPVVNIVVFVFTLLDSDMGENEYGANPKAAAI